MVNLYISTRDKDVYKGNSGDLCSYYILKKYFNGKINIINNEDVSENENLVMVGSTLEWFTSKFNTGTIIGTGLIQPHKLDLSKYSVLGVRGKLTEELTNSKAIGDMGLLISKVFPMIKNRTKKIGFVIHSVDRKEFFGKYPELKELLVDNYQEINTFLSKLNEYEMIVSSSLHGIIFSHAYNIPCVAIKVTDKIIGGDFKFKDHYSSLGYDYPGRKECRDDWEQLVKSEWQPSIQCIQSIQEEQEKILETYLKELVN